MVSDLVPPDKPQRQAGGRRLFAIARALLLLVLLLAMAAWGVQWIRSTIVYVHETDARVMADLVTVSSTADGILVDRPVKEGDRVTRGQVLAVIDSRAAIVALGETGAEHATLQASLVRIEAEVAMIEGQTEARIGIERARQAVAEANKAVQDHESAYAETDFRRIEALAATGTVPASRLDRARADFLKAQQERRRAAAEVSAARAMVGAAIADRSMVLVKQAARTELEARLAEIVARRERLQIGIADRTVRSPINGIVGRTFAISGEYVASGERLMSLHDPKQVWIETNIRETELGRLALGQTARIEIDAYPDLALEGRISRIGNAATSQFSLLPRLNDSGNFTKVTQRIKVLIDIAQQDNRLMPGMMVEIYVDDGVLSGPWSWLR